MHPMISRLHAYIEQMAAERPVTLAFVVFVVVTLIVVPASLPFYLHDTLGFAENIMAEAHGMIFDLLIIGWFMFWLNKMAERRQQSNRYREEIEDFLGWQSPEATHRIAGNIRRLNRTGITKGIRLTQAYLNAANLGGVQLEEAELWGAQMERVNLNRAVLRRANMAGANLEEADLGGADLHKVDLRGSNLRRADLQYATLTEADLSGADLGGADLQHAHLKGASLNRATLAQANLHGANLKGCDLQHINLEGANLWGSDLEGANLVGANLRGSSLFQIDLKHADLDGADLRGVRLPENGSLVACFEQARNLHRAHLDPAVERKLRHRLPKLFAAEPPAPALEIAETADA